MNVIDKNMIAPCGADCALCIGHQRDKRKCVGCLNEGWKTATCAEKCVIKFCVNRKDGKPCYLCAKYPCTRLNALDKRYHTNYNVSFIDNLNYIRDNGMDAFLVKEAQQWTCISCGNLLSVHRKNCTKCNATKENNK